MSPNTDNNLPTRWNKEVFSEFKKILEEERDYIDDKLKKDEKRNKVLAMAKSADINTLTVCKAAMLEWGGMRKNFWDMFVNCAGDGWLDVADKIREGSLNRKDAYDEFAALQKDNKLKGAGPAYFTKLIYFLTRRDREDVAQGYIMDQWAGCSINLLLDNEGVLMNVTRSWKRGIKEPQYNFTVSNANTGENYENFCKEVDKLRKEDGVRLCPDEIDRALVSKGGKNPLPWRKYVIDNRVASLVRNCNACKGDDG